MVSGRSTTEAVKLFEKCHSPCRNLNFENGKAYCEMHVNHSASTDNGSGFSDQLYIKLRNDSDIWTPYRSVYRVIDFCLNKGGLLLLGTGYFSPTAVRSIDCKKRNARVSLLAICVLTPVCA